MRRLVGCVIALVALVSFSTAPHAAELDGTLIVANRLPGAGSVSLFDLVTGVEVARLPIGPVIPHEIAVSPDGRKAVTGEYGANGNPGRRVVIIDVETARIEGYVDLGPISRPHSFAFTPDSQRVIATMEDADRIALIDLATRAVVRTLPTGGREGHMLRLSPDGAFAYVTSRGSGTLSAISLREALPPVVIPTGAGAEGLAVSPDGTEVWVVNRNAGTISVVNTDTLEVTATIQAPPRAGRAGISAGGRVVVPNTGDGDAAPLTVYHLGSRSVAAGQSVDGAGETGSVNLHVYGELVFAVDRGRRAIDLYDLTDLSHVETIAAGHPDPDGVGYSPLRVAAMAGGK